MHIDITPVRGEDVHSDGLLAALFEELDARRELVGVFASADLAKQHALDLETAEARATDEELGESDDETEQLELEWNTGANEVGDVVEYTLYDMTWTGAQYFVEPVHLNPRPAS